MLSLLSYSNNLSSPLPQTPLPSTRTRTNKASPIIKRHATNGIRVESSLSQRVAVEIAQLAKINVVGEGLTTRILQAESGAVVG